MEAVDKLEPLVRAFHKEIEQSLSFFSSTRPSFVFTDLDRNISVRLEEEENGRPGIVPLTSSGYVVLGIKPEFKCTWDDSLSFPAIDQSSFAIYPYANTQRAPLFRVEYDRDRGRKNPSAHFHVHAHRDEFTHLMGFSKKLHTEKEKKVREFLKKVPAISSFHFTNGGHRFRPILEDVLESLRVEFNLDVDKALWQEHLKTVRLTWHSIQTAAVVRDNPAAAVKVLQEEYGLKVPAERECPPERIDKINRS